MKKLLVGIVLCLMSGALAGRDVIKICGNDNNKDNDRTRVILRSFENLREADLVFVGTVSAVGPSPGFWSGVAVARQTVTYEVKEVMKGSWADPSVKVAHLLVLGSPHADQEKAGLSPQVFAVGNKLIVFAKKGADGKGFEDFDENLGTLPFSESNEEMLCCFPPPASDSACELLLKLPSKISKKKTHGCAKVEIRNVGKDPVTLVMPGDGSHYRRRTPVVGWSCLPMDSKDQHSQELPPSRGGSCGNINPLKPEEVFVLEPGDFRELEWIGFPYWLSLGKYRMAFYYSNVPNLKWGGLPLGAHDEDAMRRIKGSTPISLVSNEVYVEITE
jgi:hypothetical protein